VCVARTCQTTPIRSFLATLCVAMTQVFDEEDDSASRPGPPLVATALSANYQENWDDLTTEVDTDTGSESDASGAGEGRGGGGGGVGVAAEPGGDPALASPPSRPAAHAPACAPAAPPRAPETPKQSRGEDGGCCAAFCARVCAVCAKVGRFSPISPLSRHCTPGPRSPVLPSPLCWSLFS
jgi:hypothetical protein